LGGLRELSILHIAPVSVSANGTSLTLPPPLSTSAVSGLKGRPVLCELPSGRLINFANGRHCRHVVDC